ncbi:hypothetical protein IKB17_00815 [bacterium]|nr:hypothetical protein [bacterium]
MKVNCQNNNDILFKGFYDSKALKKCLEFAANNGTLFAATTSIALSGIRPLVILATPDTDKKNKQIACAKSLTSTLNGFLITLACSRPLSNAIKKIDINPKKYLNEDTINNLKDNESLVTNSKSYKMITQLFKLGLGFLIAVPKSILTAFCTPYMLEIFNIDKKEKNNLKNGKEVIFQGKDKLPSKIGDIINKNKKLQNFVTKNKDSNYPLHIIAATDTLSTATFVKQISKNKNFEKKDKKPLIYNSIISTILSIISTYIFDSLTSKQTNNFIDKFKQINKKDPNLSKYIEGIKIAKPIAIAGVIYYIIIPILSTFLADKFSIIEE